MEAPPKDKRTKKYKQWLEKYNNSSEGLGDDISTITQATGIDKVVKLFTPEGEDCGCDKRKETLNKLFPSNKPNCFTEDQYNAWTEFRNRKNQNEVNDDEQKLIIGLQKDILNVSIKGHCKDCSPKRWLKWIDMIDKVYDQYQ